MSSGHSVLLSGGSGLLGGKVIGCVALDETPLVSLGRSAPRGLPDGVIHQVADFSSEFQVPPEIRPSTIFHLAQSRHYNAFPSQARDIFSVNVASTVSLCGLAEEREVSNFLFASTGGVYAHSFHRLYEESSILPWGNLDFYVSSKLAGEMFVSAYSSLFNVAVARYFFIYGPGQKSSMLIPRLVSKIQQGEEIVVEGSDGIQVSPIYVDDAASATHLAGRSEFTGILNIAGDEIINIAELAELIGEILSLRPRIVRSGKPIARNLAGDNSKMRDLLGKPKTSLREGLVKLIESDFTS